MQVSCYTKTCIHLDPAKSEWADYAAVQAEYGNPSGNELTRNLSESIQLQLSQLAEPLWTDPGTKSGISVRELFSTLRQKKKKKKRRRGMFEHSPKILASEEKATTTPTTTRR